MRSGIYIIENIINGKVYVGSSTNFPQRKSNHFSALRHKKHANIYLQNAWNKYGEKNFKFKIIEYCEHDLLIKQEIFFIRQFNSLVNKNGYNLREPLENKFVPNKESIEKSILTRKQNGYTSTEESRLKASKTMKKNISEFTIEQEKRRKENLKKMQNGNKGRVHTKETKQKISKTKKDTPHQYTEIQKLKRSINRKGYKMPEVIKEKIRQSNVGKVRSEETKQKMKEAKLGKPSHRKGKKMSEESKLKMKLSALKYIQNNEEKFRDRYKKKKV